jgi:hypothetical protein
MLSQTGPNTPLTALLLILDLYTAQLKRYKALSQTSSSRG